MMKINDSNPCFKHLYPTGISIPTKIVATKPPQKIGDNRKPNYHHGLSRGNGGYKKSW